MAVQIPDSFSSRISSNGENPSRIASVAWLIAAHEDSSLIEFNPNSHDLKRTLKEYVNKNSGSGNFINGDMLKRLIPQDRINWIQGNKRFSHWITNYITELNTPQNRKSIKDPYPIQHKLPDNVPYYLIDLDRNIAIVDYWLINSFKEMSTAARYCREMEFAWKDLTKSDELFLWADGADGERKRECFWNFLKNKKPNQINEDHKFTSHEDLLIFFDNPYFSRDTKELYSQNVRRNWNQRLRREKATDEKQCNFVLPLKTLSKLDQLAKKNNLTRTEIIEILIDSEAVHQNYISERLRRKIQITTPLSD